MSSVDDPDRSVLPELPDRRRLAALSSDEWAALLLVLREVLSTATEPSDGARTIMAAPTSRLVAGRGRRQVIELLVSGGAEVTEVLARLPVPLRTAVLPPAAPAAPAAGSTVDPAELERVRERARTLQQERDTWRRRAQGAETRAAQAAAETVEVAAERDALAASVAGLEAELAAAAVARERAIARERRRRDGEVARLTEEVAELRRTEEQRRSRERRRQEVSERRTAPEPDPDPLPPARVTPGRPTRLPRGIAPGTTEAARALLGPGRLVLIDGYNVTRQHRDDLDLEGQRSWLTQRCVTAAAVLRIRPVLVFDGQSAGGSRPPAARHQVEVRFTPAGITADDELVLSVEATDEPVVVVTDDRELIGRVTASDADVVGTLAFLGAVRR